MNTTTPLELAESEAWRIYRSALAAKAPPLALEAHRARWLVANARISEPSDARYLEHASATLERALSALTVNA